MKLVEHNFVVYVGDYDDMLMLHPAIAPPSTMNPKDFFDYAKKISQPIYSNNMDFVRFYKPENVMVVCKENGVLSVRKLTKHPQYEKWKDEMDSGELVSLFGFQWVKEFGMQLRWG